ncbi:hypothetical protein Ahy_B08g093640 isoform B [Arachis hypogaea]|uniref:Carrier domain-containing protein n=1 Tax=Arachis hypogaea TaxID=3818 RepID=A0A444Y6H5_ARAHY|nr:hypothetical protein Ahy_B08g093640 isoform B [Arachis hypogaea]
MIIGLYGTGTPCRISRPCLVKPLISILFSSQVGVASGEARPAPSLPYYKKCGAVFGLLPPRHLHSTAAAPSSLHYRRVRRLSVKLASPSHRQTRVAVAPSHRHTRIAVAPSHSRRRRSVLQGSSADLANQETVQKVCDIVKKQLALPEGSSVTGESKFAALGADSLYTVLSHFLKLHL